MVAESKSLSLRGSATKAQLNTKTGSAREIAICDEEQRPYLMDGITPGGHALALSTDITEIDGKTIGWRIISDEIFSGTSAGITEKITANTKAKRITLLNIKGATPNNGSISFSLNLGGVGLSDASAVSESCFTGQAQILFSMHGASWHPFETTNLIYSARLVGSLAGWQYSNNTINKTILDKHHIGQTHSNAAEHERIIRIALHASKNFSCRLIVEEME